MKGLFPNEMFAGFGPSRIHPAGFAPLLAQVRGRKSARLRAGVRADAPRFPGIYGMIDRRGVLIYVGKAKSLRSRLMSYFRENSRDPKAGRIIARTQSIVWETATDEFGALIRELELIQRFRPRFNVQGQPGSRRYIYLALGRAPAPYVYVTREPTGKETALYGPLVGAGRVRDAARRLNDSFRLRDCSQRQLMRFADQRDLFLTEWSPGCLRYEIGTCLGPCAGFCSRNGYAANVRAVRNFLDGSDRTILGDLERQMGHAAERLEYERASALRDKLADLKWLTDRLVWLRHARAEHSYVYPLMGPDGRIVWYLIERGQVRATVYPPTNVKSRRQIAMLLEEIYTNCKEDETLMPKGQVDSVLLVAAWFRKRPAERETCLKWTDAKEACSI